MSAVMVVPGLFTVKDDHDHPCPCQPGPEHPQAMRWRPPVLPPEAADEARRRTA